MSYAYVDPDLYRSALMFAAKAHGKQKMNGSQIPYLAHVVSVTAEVQAAYDEGVHPNEYFAYSFIDTSLLIPAALLHDVLEDTDITADQLRSEFGDSVTEIVSLLTKNPQADKRFQMIDCLDAIISHPTLKLEAAAIKCCDRIVNLEDPPAHWSTEKILSYKRESEEIYSILSKNISLPPKMLARFRQKIDSYGRAC